jgi:photoactive yellow protein
MYVGVCSSAHARLIQKLNISKEINMEVVKFEGIDISEVINRMPESVKNDLPFGLLKLNNDGTILEYNMAQAEISGIKAGDVLGKNFFLDVAVCTQRPEFYGKFKEGVASGTLNLVFEYVFEYRMVPTRVRVHMFSSKDHVGQRFIWLMVKKVGRLHDAIPQSEAPLVAFNPAAQVRDVPILPPREFAPAQRVSSSQTVSDFADIMVNLTDA